MTTPIDGPTPRQPLAGLIGVPAGQVCGPDGCAPVGAPEDTEVPLESGSVPRDGSE